MGSLAQPKNAQQSVPEVHLDNAPDKWESARFHLCLRQGAGKHFSWLEVGSVKMALSHPTHQRVTRAIGRLSYTMEKALD